MSLDPSANFVRQSLASSVGTSDPETIDVGDASAFPDPSTNQYNVVIWDTLAGRPDQDPDVEVVRVQSRDTTNDALTVARGQEGTSNVSHPSTSDVMLSPTSKMFSDIDSQKLGDGQNFDGQSSSTFSNVKSVSTESLDSIDGYSDETNPRTFDTWYQNTTGGDMEVIVTARSDVDGTNVSLIAHVNETQSNFMVARIRNPGGVNNGYRNTVQFRVPAGYYYQVQRVDDAANTSMVRWVEQT